ncbi:hypothetical protein [Chryseobacterium sp. SIMBA_028]|uniref:hypothetical protein n=1 Tax=Chryseobacterium sp. SIMBA_028 TaxID=3085771 RepID=UPI003978F6E2
MEENFNELDPKWNTAEYDEIWNDRLQFFQLNGAPDSKTFKNALKQRPGFKMKARISMNFYAFFFEIIYFLSKECGKEL